MTVRPPYDAFNAENTKQQYTRARDLEQFRLGCLLARPYKIPVARPKLYRVSDSFSLNKHDPFGGLPYAN